ncbi:unnamed protein product, partial [marine sediment metagenome]
MFKKSHSDRLAKKRIYRGWSAADIVNLSVRKAREIVPLIEDTELLKRAAAATHQVEGKHSLRFILSRRIQLLDHPEFEPRTSRPTGKKKRKKNRSMTAREVARMIKEWPERTV